MIRRTLPKVQPRRRRTPSGFSTAVQDIIKARSGGICELDACGRAEVIHHRRPRGSGGSSLAWVNQAANGFHVSSACHDRIEGKCPPWSRIQSTALGWLVPYDARFIAVDAAVLYRNRWVHLDNEGGVSPAPIEGDPS